jgi:hypothetical protein
VRRIRNRLNHWHARASRDLALLTNDPAALDALFELAARIERDLLTKQRAGGHL